MFHILIILSSVVFYSIGIMGGRKALICFIAGVLINGGYLLYRSFHLGHLPVTGKYDVLLFTGLLCGVYLLRLYRSLPHDSNYILLLPVVFLFFAIFQERVDTISPEMNSLWLYLHMTLFVFAFSLLSTGSATGIIYLMRKDSRFELLQYRFILSGWLFFSLSLIAGSVWFFLAQGVYWLWTAKELWLTITWFYYGLYLHGRYVDFLKGETASEIAVAGVFVILFAYLGVTPVLGSPWTQF